MARSGGPHVVVVGGGIAGLAAAYAIRSARPDIDVTVLEGSARVGGKLARTELAGIPVDVGAESLLNRRPEAVELARAVGLADDVVHPEPARPAVWTRGALRPMPPTVLGVPADLAALRRSGVLSPAGVLRARADLPRAEPDEDVSVASFVGTRLGAEVVDRLVEPLLGGVYAGRADRLSVRAAAPQVAALAADGGRIARAAARVRAGRGTEAPVFAGIVGGVGRLADSVATASGAQVRVGATVRELHRAPDGGGWTLVVGPTAAPEEVRADAVVLAVPAAPAGRLMTALSSVAARRLREIEYASTALVSVAVGADAFPDGLRGSGFLVPPVDGRSVKAATYSTQKWGWLGRAADGLVLARASIGRAGEAELLQREDSELVALAVADLHDAVGLRGHLLDAHVQRWGGALPQYAVGHLDLVADVERAVDGLPGLALAGAAYHGVGVAAVIATAQDAAARVLEHLSPSLGGRGRMDP